MSADTKKTLLFIKAPQHDLKSVEAFLNKRNFNVLAESDLKEALGKLLEHSPDFIFLALDHPNPKINSLPKLISQASSAMIVPFAMNSGKEAIFKLNICPLTPKLYPPISGPSIERLVLKQTKIHDQAASANQLGQPPRQTQKTDAPMNTQMKAKLLASFDSQTSESEAIIIESKGLSSAPAPDRVSFIQKKNELLTKSEKIKLPVESVEKLKKSFQEKVKTPLQAILRNLSESKQNSIETEGVMIEKGLQSPIETDGVIIEKGLQSGVGIAYLPPEEALTTGATAAASSRNETTYCMSIYSDNWCGYLFIATDAELDFSTVDLVFSEWIKLQFDGFHEVDEYDFFEITNLSPATLKKMMEGADYYETAEIDGHQLTISFFPISPDRMALALSEDQQLIKINTEDIPCDHALNFSLHLHLPENKKMLMYTPVNKSLSEEQKNRLMKNSVNLLYSPIDYEKEIKKFMAEKNVRDIYENLNKKLTVT